ncbi:MAG: enoyl-[acyl-carrier protein] reductase III, partial [Saprospiraceae bacterium]
MKELPHFKGKNYWAIVLGGSSGFGLATAKKMADEGMNICILHRDRRQQMEWIKGAFLAIESLGVKLLHFNVDATREDKQLEVVEVLKKELKNGGKIRLLLHSISKGNLKQLSKSEAQPIDFEKLMYDERIVESYKFVDSIFESPYDENSPTLSRKDFEITLQNMALSLLDWV